MKDWIKVTLLLCAFGTLREIRPSEPFVSEFLLGEWRNITETQLNQDVYPVGTYSYLAQLVVIFLITDFLRFKPVIIVSGISGAIVYAILLWTSSLEWLQASQFFYGTYMATEVAYLTYIYAKVDSSKYPRVSSYTRIAALIGRFVSGTSAQLLTHYQLMDYRDLNYITFAAQILATFWALWLPPVQFGIYFHRKDSNANTDHFNTDERKEKLTSELPQSFQWEIVEASRLISRHARSAYGRGAVLAWSALYAAALALYVQAQVYVQLLWKNIQEDSLAPIAYNGAVEAAQTLVGAAGALAAGSGGGAGGVARALPAAAAAVQAAALFLATYVPNIFVSYAGYIVVGVAFHFTITLASAKIASELRDESCFGLIFGINTLFGTGLQSLLTLILIQVLQLSIYSQYYVLSVLYCVLAIFWLLGWIINSCNNTKGVDLQY